MRTASVERKTGETEISVRVDIDGVGESDIVTGIGFFDHMLEQLARHSLIDIAVRADGDLHIDGHHTVEDTGLALGQAMSEALGERRGITRFAHTYIPMDETLTRVAVDISGRGYLVWHVQPPRARLGALDTELVPEFFKAFSGAVGMTLHVETLYGSNSHHMVESCFKGLARALRKACEIDSRASESVPSTKGSIGGSL